jgi:hypothetical protein
MSDDEEENGEDADKEMNSSTSIETHYLIIINKHARFVILGEDSLQTVESAMKAYRELFPKLRISGIEIIPNASAFVNYSVLYHMS